LHFRSFASAGGAEALQLATTAKRARFEVMMPWAIPAVAVLVEAGAF